MTADPRADRELDIVLFGATGFAGRLTAAHLASAAPEDVRIALAGRSEARLKAVRAGLGDAAADWPLIVVDASDEAAVRALAERTQVVVTTVGPYAKFGMPLVAACAEAGTDYCDLTGEVLFVHRSIAAFHDIAQRTGARIVHSCGFDSVPSDLGVMLTAEGARADGAGDLGFTRLAVRTLKGGISGGTIDSARNQVQEGLADKGARRLMADPWALAEGGRPKRPKRPVSSGAEVGAGAAAPSTAAGADAPDVAGSGATGTGAGARSSAFPGPLGVVLKPAQALLGRLAKESPVRRDVDNGHFTGPFVMASFNTRIVARSASINHYGDGFRYIEYSDFGAGPKGAVTAAAVAAGLGIGLAGFAFAPTRALLDRVLPKPGEGPSEEAQKAGRFRMEVTGETTSGSRYRTVVAAPYDPGYSGTAIMLGQSALALVEDRDRLPDRAGVLTPATAIGAPLVDRLRTHGFTLETTPL